MLTMDLRDIFKLNFNFSPFDTVFGFMVWSVKDILPCLKMYVLGFLPKGNSLKEQVKAFCFQSSPRLTTIHPISCLCSYPLDPAWNCLLCKMSSLLPQGFLHYSTPYKDVSSWPQLTVFITSQSDLWEVFDSMLLSYYVHMVKWWCCLFVSGDFQLSNISIYI